MHPNWIPLVASMAVVACAQLLHADEPASPAVVPQHAETFNNGKTHLDYLLHLPADYPKSGDKTWPLILFLHGSGERGTDVTVVKQHGPPQIVEKEPDSALARQFIVVSPQCPPDVWWNVDDLSALLDDVIVKYHVDTDRVYLTGLSMGGFGTWSLAAKTPDRFAAIVPVCGGGKPDMVERLKGLPIWVFHGEKDTSVPVKRSDEMVDALKAVGADVKFTRYEGVGHNCWSQTYANPELYTWLLSHKRAGKKTDGDKPAGGATPETK